MPQPDFDARISELGISLPEPPHAYFNYLPSVVSGRQLYISGQLSGQNGELKHFGALGANASLESAAEAARLCGLNILAQVRSACGGTLNQVARCTRLTGFVSASPDYRDHAQAMEGCSSLMHEVFGELGRHARTCVGVASLPFNALVEVEAIFELLPSFDNVSE